MNKYATATFLFTTVTIASAISIIGPAAFALVAGKNKVSALSKPPNAAAEWLDDNACESIKASVTTSGALWLIIAGLFFSVLNPPIVYGINRAYRHCVKKYPSLGSLPYDGSSSGRFMNYYHKLLPNREAFVLFGSFLITTTAFTAAMVEIVAGTMKDALREGFNPDAYACHDDLLTAPFFVNQIIMSMAGPVSKAARLAAYLPAVFSLAGSSVITLGSAAAIGIWRKSAGEQRPLVAEPTATVGHYGAAGL